MRNTPEFRVREGKFIAHLIYGGSHVYSNKHLSLLC